MGKPLAGQGKRHMPNKALHRRLWSEVKKPPVSFSVRPHSETLG